MDDDRPTNPRALRPSTLSKMKEAFESVKTIVTVLVTVGGGLWTGFSFMATDEELLQHNLAQDAHKAIRSEIADLRAETVMLKVSYQRCYEDAGDLGWRYVSLVAADRESDHRLKAAAGYFYRDEFISLWKSGKPMSEAINSALRTPWHDRPKIK